MMELPTRLSASPLVLILLAACAATPAAPCPVSQSGSMGDGFRASACSSEGPTHWSLERRGGNLLLERDGLRAEIRGFEADVPLEFEQDEDQGLWRFRLPDGRSVTWLGDEVRLGDQVWRLAVGTPLVIDLSARG